MADSHGGRGEGLGVNLTGNLGARQELGGGD